MAAVSMDYLPRLARGLSPEGQRAPRLNLKLSASELSSGIQGIREVQFSPYLDRWIAEYEKVGERGRFLWQWCLKGVRMITLPSVEEALREHVVETKMLSIIFGTLIDDIADREQDSEMLQVAIGAASGESQLPRLELWHGRRRAYLETISGLWAELWDRCKRYPRLQEFEPLLRFDNDQILNAMRYALLTNQCPGLLNVIEHDIYQPHNMQIMFMGTLDLCASPSFNRDELGMVREIFWHAQRMGRIGNMITTWEREVLDRDFTSGIFAFAVHRGVLNAEDLRTLPAHEIMGLLEAAECQDHFVNDWSHHRDEIERKIEKVRSVDLRGYLAAFEELLNLHLCSRGLM